MRDRSGDNPIVANAIKIAGSQAALADRCGCAQQHISKLLKREVAITAEMAVAIERATDFSISRSEMRPDLWPRGEDAAA